MLHVQGAFIHAVGAFEPFAFHLPADCAGQSTVFEDPPPPRLKNFSSKYHKRRDKENQNDHDQGCDNILEIDEVHSLMHDPIGDSARNHCAQRETKYRKGAQRCADELEPAAKIGMSRHQMEVKAGNSPQQKTP